MGREKPKKTRAEMDRLWSHVDGFIHTTGELKMAIQEIGGAIIRMEQFVFPILKVLINNGALTLQQIEEAQKELQKANTLGDLLGVGEEAEDPCECEPHLAVAQEPTEDPE